MHCVYLPVCCWLHLGIDSLALDHSVTPNLPSSTQNSRVPTGALHRHNLQRRPSGRPCNDHASKKRKPTLAAASSPAAGQAVAMDPAFMYSSDCNAHLTVRIKDALSTVDGADVFHDLTVALPLGIPDSGVQPPFAKTAYHSAIRTHNTYTCGSNLFWSRFDFSPNPRARRLPGIIPCTSPVI